jgi:hypothetical protein
MLASHLHPCSQVIMFSKLLSFSKKGNKLHLMGIDREESAL